MKAAPSSKTAGTGLLADVLPAAAWLAAAEETLAGCSGEEELIAAGCRLALDRLRPRQLALALVPAGTRRIVCVAYHGLSGREAPADTAQPFEPCSPLRSLLCGEAVDTGGPGWFVGDPAGCDAAWPFAAAPGERLWLSLRAGGEVAGCLVLDLAGTAGAMSADIESLRVFAGLLALHLQVRRLQRECDGRIAEQIATAQDNARLTEAEAVARARAEALLRAGQAMNCSIDLKEVMRVVTREAHQALRAATCDLFLYDEHAASTTAHFTDGYDLDAALDLQARETLQSPPVAIPSECEMLERMAPVLIDTSATPLVDESPAAHLGYASRILVPLLVERGGTRAVLGAMYVNYTDKLIGDIEPEEIDLAGAMAAQAATALEKARLYEIERDRAHRFQELDNLRKEFLATVSHELRTPLTGIIGFAETLSLFWEQLSDERRRGSIDKMLTAAQRLERLVRDLLLASRIEDARFAVHMAPVAAGTAVRQAADEIRATYRNQGVCVEADDDLQVQADAERLAQILVNLLDNAVKYSPEGSPVVIGLRQEGDTARFWVGDKGPGINPRQMERLFERFGKLGHVPRFGTGGTGLGLYITRRLVRAMGGEIAVQSVPGQGSTFAFSLAMAPPEGAGDRSDRSDRSVGPV